MNHNMINTVAVAFSGRMNEFAASPIFHDMALLFIFIYAATPAFIPAPNELLTIPAYAFGVTPLAIILAVGIGGFVGDSLMYKFARKIHHKWKGKTAKNVNHYMYKYKHLIFVASPSLFFGIGDIIIIFAAIKHIPYREVAPYLLIGNLVRAVWGMGLVLLGVELFF